MTAIFRARMKVGVRPIILSNGIMVPEHPVYWDVPADSDPAVGSLVRGGQCEYEPVLVRGTGGQFAVALDVQRPPPRDVSERFKKKVGSR